MAGVAENDSNAKRILFVGASSGTSAQRMAALRRLGHEVVALSPYQGLPPYWRLWQRRTGGPGIDSLVARLLRPRLHGEAFDLAIVDSGDVVGRSSLSVIRGSALAVGVYCADNPFHEPLAEGKRWNIFRRACRGYDLIVTPRRDGAEEAVLKVTGKVPLQVWFSADELVHQPLALPDTERKQWSTDVVFVGTWMPGRDDFIVALIERGVRVRIYGPRWQRAPRYERIASAVSDTYLAGDDYTKAIAGAKIALVLLNRQNRDLHTSRSVEIPAIGTAMAAPRTEHHMQLYEEGREAVFFVSIDECAEQCRTLLADDARRVAIAEAGRARTFVNRTYNEFLMKEIVERLAGGSPRQAADAAQ